MKIKVYLLNLCRVSLAVLFMAFSTSLYAADQAPSSSGSTSAKITGVVKDSSGAPVIGVGVIEKGTTNGVVTDVNGAYTIAVKASSVLQFQCLGYTDQEQTVGSRRTINVVLETSAESIEDVIIVGYGTQKKASLTGAVSQIANKDIITTKNENVQNMLTGKVSGLRIVQKSSEPGQFNNSMDIRGFGAPLVIIDGVPRKNMARLDAEDIETISVLKDASAAVYGFQGSNGVVIITTKKGDKNNSNINYSGSMSWQVPTNFPGLTNATEWMQLFNEKEWRSIDNPTPDFTAADFEAYANGTKKSTDWIGETFRDSAPQNQHTISASGGTDAVSYYASIGYQDQGSFLKTDAINYEKYTVRSNFSAKINRNLKFEIGVSGLMDERNNSAHSADDIVRAMWLVQPRDQVYYDKEKGIYAQPDNAGLSNPVVMMNKGITGYSTNMSKWFQSGASLTYTVPYVEGLSLKGFYSYDFTLNDDKGFRTPYTLQNASTTRVVNKGSNADNKVDRYYYSKNATLWNIQASYNRSFDKHNLSALLLFENSHNFSDNFGATSEMMLPVDQIFAGKVGYLANQTTHASNLYDYANQGLVGRINYDFAGKYIAEVAFRYDGSSRFPKEGQWGLFPSISAGWRISEEKFWKNLSIDKVVNNFKLRSSYGVTGNDIDADFQSISTPGFVYPPSGTGANALPPGSVFDGKFITGSGDKGLINRAVTWYEYKTFNVGFDMEAWHGLLGFTAEYFRRDGEGLLARRTESLPGVVGATLPQENLNSNRTQGFELELSHRNSFGDFNYQIKGNMSFTRTKLIYTEQARGVNSYDNWHNNKQNRYNDLWWGYLGNGRMTNWDEIYYNPLFINRNSVLGDYEYVDWNGDGQITALDEHPIATNGVVPLIYYGFTISADWKGIDFSMLWQGTGKRYVIPRQFLASPLWQNTNALDIYTNRWHTADAAQSPYDPAADWVSGKYAYTGLDPMTTSDFNVQNAAYLRLKNLEIGYTLPKKWLSTVNIKNVRVYVSGYNLLTFTKVKFMDPESYTNPDTTKEGLADLGYTYPMNRTFSIGLNVKF